jgi:hypothetical protein
MLTPRNGAEKGEMVAPEGTDSEAQGTAIQIDTSVPHVSRVYDYWLGGKDNYAVDRALAEKVIAAEPYVIAGVRSNRAFLGRAVHCLAADAGIRQFLDIGTGIPTANNTHEVAQRAAPDARVVYVDNDPIVLVHARALLTSNPAGITNYLDADLRDTTTILAEAQSTLDFSLPVAVMLVGVLHCIPEADDPASIIATLMAAVPPGSHLVISHIAADLVNPQGMAAGNSLMNRAMAAPITARTHAQVAGLFDGLDLLEPGLVPAPQWRPEPGTESAPLPVWAGVGRKP